jgi:hypothetical protein
LYFYERTEKRLKNDLFESSRQQLLQKKLTARLLILSLVYSAVLMPLLNLVNSNVLYSATILSPVLDLVLLVCNYFIYWMAFAYLLYGIARFGLSACKGMAWIFVGVSFLRPALGFLMTYWMGLDALDLLDLRDFLVSGAVDCLQLVLAIAIVNRTDKNLVAKHKLIVHMPLAGLFVRQNPVVPVIVKLAAVPAALYMATRVIYDLTAVFVSAPETMWEYLWMFMGYFSDRLFAFVGYMIIVLLLNSIVLSEERALMEYEESLPKTTPKKRK